ncbi:Mei4-dependent protein 6 [Ephemerocybe angulata]|uniref:Mei4-dependent protein 6 n=1 Tax=Ephemerocybe angulata TaxID=980116 RepID=A0A8H6ID85_9AGAR|nr:Mei4-dependent protein 6 [Tulosesus angulatus]
MKPHPCNVKEFKVYVGLTEDSMTQVLHAGLKNNVEPETFDITHINSSGVVFPTRYVKIEPLSAHGQSFHVSIWHVALKGITESSYVDKMTSDYEEYRETTVLRHILKHLRQRRLLTPYRAVIERSGIKLENPVITKLHESLVLQGNWDRAEQLLASMSDADLFTEYIHSCEPQAVWARLLGTDADGDIPSPRGGHAMCMDPENELIYLFGGWDGRKSLDDFWVYNIREDKWKILSHSTTLEHNAPGPRSCHKMVFDVKTGNVYLLGRLDDADVRAPIIPRHGMAAAPSSATPAVQGNILPSQGMPYIMQQSPLRQQFTPSSQPGTPQPSNTARTYCSEFYRYQTRGIDAGKWVFLSFDTASSGGPPLMFDHQMVMDTEAQILYVSGGRVVDGDWEKSSYSGLYSYTVRTSKWKLLQHGDVNATGSSSSHVIPPRFGHSMVLEPNAKQLYIFGGQRDDRYLSDMHVYDITSNSSTELFSNFTASGGPDPCFTQRAVIDPVYKEIYIFCGLTRNAATGSKNTVLRSSTSNWTFRYDTKPGKWFQIGRHPDTSATEVPLPRFAHQAVYHAPTRRVFIHGGNAGGLGLGVEAAGGGSAGGGDGSTTVSANASVRPSPSPPADAAPSAGPTAAATQSQEGEEALPRDKRLDDLWMMKLKRPGVEEVVRQAKFCIRRQQFREMCEQEEPVKALQFLQNEVSSVVDHANPAEAETFRSLLTHLLAPQPAASILSLPARLSRTAAAPSGDSWSSSLASSRDSSNSRGGKSNSSDGSNGGTWTSHLPGEEERGEGEVDADGDAYMAAPGRGTADTLRGIIDPLEIAASKAAARGDGGKQSSDASILEGPMSLTAERYKQRTDVFNNLLRFVAESQKEPVGDLLDMVNQDGVDGVVDTTA